MKALATWLLGLLCVPIAAQALVKFDEGNRVIDGVQLLQDADDEKVYYYLPQYPRLATKEDGETLEFLCVKFVGNDQVASGGIFHALVTFGLPEEQEEELRKSLAKQVSGAELRGPVPLLQTVEDGEEGGFRVVSATLADTDGGFTRNLVTSGRAPLTPGSKAVLAAMLEAEGATLLWDSLQAPTSDVSVAISAYYEALVRGYNATVSAEMETIYTHFSQFSNQQKNYTKKEIRNVLDQLQRTGDLKVEVVDRSQSVNLDSSDMQGLLDIVTSRITDLMFDTDTGWSATPPKEQAVTAGQVKGRREYGAFVKFFAGDATNDKYVTDNQYVLKRRTDIQRNRFFINLSKSTTIKVPVDTAGNLGGIYDELHQDTRYFRVVNLADPVFQKRSVQFQIDGNYVDSFQDTINFVSVNFRKRYPDQPDMTSSLVFTHEDIREGRIIKEIEYPRMGLPENDWQDFEYQVRWSVRDRPTVSEPQDAETWIHTQDPAVSLVPPFQRRDIEIEADRYLFADRGIVSAVLEFATPIAGKPKLMRKATLRETDAEPSQVVSIYHDRGKPVGWRVTWYSREGKLRSDAQGLDSDYLYLVPPDIPASE